MHPKRTPLIALATLSAAALLPAAGSAQDAVTLDPVILSAGFAPQAADAYGRAATVLTAAEIEARGIATVQDALRAVPGVSVSSAGTSFTQVRIRGAEASHSLILIDGIEVAGGGDEYVLTGLETANIDRIEVLRGPQSVYYGSNASAGVINIITRGGEPGLHYGGGIELGNGAAASAHVSRNGERGGLALNLSARDDHGFDLSGDGGEKDGIHRKTLGLSGWVQATEALRLGATLRRSWERYDSDALATYDVLTGGYVDAGGNPVTGPEGYVNDDPALFGKRDERQGALWAEFASLDGRLTHRLDYQDSVFKQNNEGAGWTTGKTRKLKYRGSLGLDGRPVEDAAHILGLLAERQEDSSTAAPDYRREMTSLALEYRGFLDNGLNLQAGVRHDDNRVFDDFTSWTLALSWQVPDRPFRLHASAGTGLVNPSYYELYADDGYTRGNPYLRPEKNRGFDLGVELSLPDGRGSVDLTYFRETLEDEITYVGGTAPDWRGTYVNQPGESPREGVELAARVNATRNLDLALNYTYLDAKDPDGAVEIRRPRHELGLSATLAVLDGRGSLTADLRHVSGNFDTQFWNDQTREMPSFTVVNLAAGYDLTDNIRLTGRVVNLFDRDYSEVWGYATQGRTAYAGLQARW